LSSRNHKAFISIPLGRIIAQDEYIERKVTFFLKVL
jgi:hypothetical protein